MAITANHAPLLRHLIRCTYCDHPFDLFAATWCTHGGAEASKICPACTRCLCAHPAYGDPHCWTEAPAGFQKRGFRRLFLFYL
jgi:hypothetical protein